MTAVLVPRQSQALRAGLALALTSAAAFGLSGALGKSLLDIGWSPGAVVLFRIGGAALVLLIPGILLLRRWRPTGRAVRGVTLYGITAVAGAQLCYFSAIQYLSVGVALLIEYSAPVLLIIWSWLRTRQRPPTAVLIGAALAMVGMAFVLNLTGGVAVHPLGVLWALGAAVGLCCYFVLADDQTDAVPPVLMASAGTVIGTIALALLGLTHVLPMTAGTQDTMLAGSPVPWWVPALALVLITAVLAYLTGIFAVRRLGSSKASFVALTELLFAVGFAIVLVAQVPTWTQLVGGIVMICGIAVVQKNHR